MKIGNNDGTINNQTIILDCQSFYIEPARNRIRNLRDGDTLKTSAQDTQLRRQKNNLANCSYIRVLYWDRFLSKFNNLTRMKTQHRKILINHFLIQGYTPLTSKQCKAVEPLNKLFGIFNSINTAMQNDSGRIININGMEPREIYI